MNKFRLCRFSTVQSGEQANLPQLSVVVSAMPFFYIQTKQKFIMDKNFLTSVRRPSRLWYLLPIFLAIVGGVIGYFIVKSRDRKFAGRLLLVGLAMTAVWVVANFALGGSDYSYTGGLFAPRTGKIVKIDAAATFCNGTDAIVYVKNVGAIDYSADNVTILKQGYGMKLCSVTPDLVVAGRDAFKCSNTLGAADGITSGSNTIVVGGVGEGPTNAVRINLLCP